MRLASLVTVAALTLTACTSSVDDETGSSEDALTSLTAAGCATPRVTTAPRLSATGTPIEGTAHTTLSGCILARASESGTALVGRVSQRLGDTASFGRLKNDQGEAIFSRFTARAATGTLAAGLVQEVDVELDADYSPATRLRVVRRLLENGTYELTITNITRMRASIAFIPVTVVEPGNLAVRVTVHPEENGVTLTGTGDVTLEKEKGKAGETSQLVRDVFEWLRTELAAPER